MKTMSLAELREHMGLTQAEVAKKLGVTQPEVSRIETVSMLRLHVGTLRDYVQAVGGELDIYAIDKDGRRYPLKVGV